MSPKVLIVDDNTINLKLASDVLTNEGFVVERAQDAEQAKLVLERLLPDLILMDIAMPGMDGLTLTRVLKSDPRFTRIPVIALTASAMKGDDQRALAAGCAGYIAKPIDTRRFGAQVRAMLRAATSSDPA
jgi:CheY-like chemotaxis protein